MDRPRGRKAVGRNPLRKRVRLSGRVPALSHARRKRSTTPERSHAPRKEEPGCFPGAPKARPKSGRTVSKTSPLAGTEPGAGQAGAADLRRRGAGARLGSAVLSMEVARRSGARRALRGRADGAIQKGKQLRLSRFEPGIINLRTVFAQLEQNAQAWANRGSVMGQFVSRARLRSENAGGAISLVPDHFSPLHSSHASHEDHRR